jgi:predicted dehydrogenase
MGYEFEIRAFVDEILSGNKTNLDLLSQAAKTIAIIEAEKISIETCSVVTIKA